MISYLDVINKVFYGMIVAGTGARVGYIALQLIMDNVDSNTAKSKIMITVKGAILAATINSLVIMFKKYFGE